MANKHLKIFDDFWLPELTIAQTYQCAVCHSWEGTDIHHLKSRGMSGSKCKDYIENLICLCRSCHNKCHSDKNYNLKARIINLENIADKLKDELNG
jgi:hypothetical protein